MKTIIIGSGPAGYYCASKLMGPEESITLLDGEGVGFYSKIRLPDYVAGEIPREKIFLSLPNFLTDKGVEVKSGLKAISINVDKKTLSAGEGGKVLLPWDRLVLATGGTAFIPPVEGAAAKDILVLRSLEDAEKLLARTGPKKQVLVMGGGLLGLEAAWALIKRDCIVRVVEYFPNLLPRQLSPEQGEEVKGSLEQRGFVFNLGQTLIRLEHSDSGKYTASLSSGESLEVDAVLASAGVRPNCELAKKAGIAVHRGILVNERLQTSVPNIFAIGDCTELADGSIPGLWMAASHQAEALCNILKGKQDSYQIPMFTPKLKIADISI